MTVIAITRALNEVDIIAPSILRMLTQVDHIICGNGPSTDGTREALLALAAEHPITLLDDGELSWKQNEVITGFAQMARDMSASWVVPFDIDEVWYSPRGRIGDVLDGLPLGIALAPARLWTHSATAMDDQANPDPISRMGWRGVDALVLPKMAARALPSLRIGHGSHGAEFTDIRKPASITGVLYARHYPYRTPEQFIKRVRGAWPQLRDSGLPEWHGSHMWAYGRALDEGGPEALERWFADGMFCADPEINPELVFDPCPVGSDAACPSP
jgi:hypothetical protein